MVRAVNKFKADFGGEVVSLERVQPSSDHVPHRFLLDHNNHIVIFIYLFIYLFYLFLLSQ